MKDYIELASRTCAKDANIYNNYVDQQDYNRAMHGFAAAAERLEHMKKQVFYGRDISHIPSIDPLQINSREELEDLHANLGIAGESIELIDANTREEVLLEAGDLLWYIAKKLKNYGISFEEAMEANVAKLKERYPERFDVDIARNLG